MKYKASKNFWDLVNQFEKIARSASWLSASGHFLLFSYSRKTEQVHTAHLWEILVAVLWSVILEECRLAN